jgi:hypothetical protein
VSVFVLCMGHFSAGMILEHFLFEILCFPPSVKCLSGAHLAEKLVNKKFLTILPLRQAPYALPHWKHSLEEDSMPNTNGQTFTPATASGLNRRQIRKHLMGALEGLACISRVDGSLDIQMSARVHGTFQQSLDKVKQEIRSLGFTPRFLGAKSSEGAAKHIFTVACQETVSQGMCGAHFYSGTGQYILSGSKHEAFHMSPEGLPLSVDSPTPQVQQEQEQEPQEQQEQGQEQEQEQEQQEQVPPVMDLASERQASRSRRGRARS